MGLTAKQNQPREGVTTQIKDRNFLFLMKLSKSDGKNCGDPIGTQQMAIQKIGDPKLELENQK